MSGTNLLHETWRSLFGYERRRQLRRFLTGEQKVDWCRVVMNQKLSELLDGLAPAKLKVLEISGNNWERKGFGSYKALHYPEFDICAGSTAEHYDLIILDQVLEHVLWPFRAVKNLNQMLTPGGYALVATPFLLRLHHEPTDCSRWTELGLKHLLAEGGFPLEKIKTGSWGNRACVVANFNRWMPYRSRIHSLANEPDFPVVVWALAQK